MAKTHDDFNGGTLEPRNESGRPSATGGSSEPGFAGERGFVGGLDSEGESGLAGGLDSEGESGLAGGLDSEGESGLVGGLDSEDDPGSGGATQTGIRLPTLLLGIGAPTLVAAAALVIVLASVPLLPNPVAIHWGVNGKPDGYGSPLIYVLIIILLAWVLPMIMVFPLLRTPSTSNVRFMVVSAVWLSVFISVISAASVLSQRGIANWKDAPGVGSTLLYALLIACVIALASYLLFPKVSLTEIGMPATPLPLNGTQVVAWSSTAAMSPVFTVSLGVAILVTGVAGLFFAPHYLLAVTALMIVLALMMTVFKVSVGRQGLVVRGLLGWPGITVPLDQIARVDLVDVAPLQEWGGWGWRYRPGGVGVIMRSGSAIQVVKTDGRTVVVTAEDSRSGAGALAAMVGRAQSMGE